VHPFSRFVLVFALFVTGCALNRQPSGPSNEQGVSETSIRSHMAFLASDALNGRGSGTRDEWITAAYLGAEMLRWMIEPMGDKGGFVQEVQVDRDETTAPPLLTVGGQRFTHGREILVQSLGRARVSGKLQKYRPGMTAAPGAVILMTDSAAPPDAHAPAGAAAVLSPETPQSRQRWTQLARRLPSPAARFKGIDPGASRPSMVILDHAAYAAISAIADGTLVTLEARVKPAQRSSTWNAVGRLPGSDPALASEVILLSAHLDHEGNRAPREASAGADTIFNGADDDASGTIAVLELAAALSRGPRPKRTIVFAFFGSEETGGYGARFFADRPVVPLDRIVANLQFEMIGRPDRAVPPHTLWLTGYERSNLGPALVKQGARLVQDPHPEQNFFTRSDNIQFARRGVVAHTVSSFGLHQDYHQPSDEIGSIDFPHMTESIRSMLEPIRWLANGSFKPEWLAGKKP
jgi:hypothetical protein